MSVMKCFFFVQPLSKFNFLKGDNIFNVLKWKELQLLKTNWFNFSQIVF